MAEIIGRRRSQQYLEISFRLEDERILEILEENEVKPSQAKVNKLKKLYAEVEMDLLEELEGILEEFLSNIIQEEWGE
jgi:hypothetical protein